MNLSIRHWLAERQIEISHIKSFTLGQLAGVSYRIVQDMEVKSLMPLDICTLAELLQLPLDKVEQEAKIIASLTEHLLNSLSQKKALKRNEGTWLTFQIAYILALEQVLHQEDDLQKPWLNRARIPSQTVTILQDTQLQGLLKTLSPGKLTDTQAEQALSVVGDSLLVQQMNNATVAWLVANGAEEFEAKLLTQRLQHSLPGYLLTVIAKNAAPLAQLQKFFHLGSLGEISTIDLSKEKYRASLIQSLSTPLLIESFALKDIYIPLMGVPQAANHSQPVDLKTWVTQQLTDLESITVIESEPGYGKTSFCQIWAAEIAWELYPDWMPIVIRLRDIKYGKNLLETLNSGFAFPIDFNLAAWLNKEHSRCVLLLDGLDELPPTNLVSRHKEIFLEQLLQFQSELKHKVVLTSRRETLSEISSEISLQWQRITILPWEVNELKNWFQQWALVQSLPVAQNFFTFLKQSGCFNNPSKLPEISHLVRQPLMLYLLGILHRDGLLDHELLQLAVKNPENSHQSLIGEIYRRLNLWLLGYPLDGNIKTTLYRPGSAHIHRTSEAIANLLAAHHPQDLITQMQAIALKILHSDRHQVIIPEGLNAHTLPAFYFRCFTSKIEFSHPKLGNYLFAGALAQQLQILTQCQEDIYGVATFILNTPHQVAQHLYHLLGYGILTPEITELLIADFQHQPKSDFSQKTLFQRLASCWHDWYQGRWLDMGIAHNVLPNFHTLQNPVNVEQVNTNVGVNIFLLMAAISQKIATPFYPCGNPVNLTEFHPQAMLTLITKASLLPNNIVMNCICPQSLTKINLKGANLSQVVLTGANFAQADLSYAILVNANLAHANLTGANLTCTNLTGANLTGVNLETVNLSNACLSDAILTESEREIAALNGALFSVEQFQEMKGLLSQQSHFSVSKTTDNTSVWQHNSADIALMESLEGEPIVSTISGNYSYDE
ncbi:pentapeptide repeat-containing protein [Nostoc sp. TCL26-01]|uniref:pentapeptide repeat-containing protein n=1 Tax=Nostoc sp. TCL26-01 TaxID=2576904 RepID=UPI0015C0BBEF|nr:pentapeptide repeat-containing protein [Nostoc sp. TCL26-01]QLE55249.1 hypothetical protein FD725_06820 [Nostoc sp. TCL26-01]